MKRNVLICTSAGLALGIAATAALQPWPIAVAVQAPANEATAGPARQQTPEHLMAARARGGEREREREITPELIERVIEVASDVDEPMARRLRALCDQHPQELERVMRTTGRRFIALADLKSRDPELYDLKIRELQSESRIAVVADQIAKAWVAGDKSREEALQQEMLTLARVHVGMSLAARQLYLKRLQEHVEALKQELERDARNFDETVDRRITEAIEQAMREGGPAMTRNH